MEKAKVILSGIVTFLLAFLCGFEASSGEIALAISFGVLSLLEGGLVILYAYDYGKAD